MLGGPFSPRTGPSPDNPTVPIFAVSDFPVHFAGRLAIHRVSGSIGPVGVPHARSPHPAGPAMLTPSRPQAFPPVVLRVDGLEPRSSPALIWAGWGALDPLLLTDEYGAVPAVSSVFAPTAGNPIRPAAPTDPAGTTPPTGGGTGGGTLVPLGSPQEFGQTDTDFTGGKPFSYESMDPETGPGGDDGGHGRAPVITSFGASGSVGLWTFSGTVEDDTPAGLVVRLGGVPDSLEGKTATTDSVGRFSLTLVLQTNGTDTGTASADTTDPDGNPSNTATYYVNP